MSNAFRELAKQRPQQEPEKNTGKCHADHCPCMGSVSFDGGRFCCSAHAFSVSDKWPAITEKLHEFRWLIAFTDDIQRMDQSQGKGAPIWRDYAAKFWGGVDEHCMPHPKEDCLPYQIRMRKELLYRLGQIKRPEPRIPEPVKSRGNAGRLLHRGASA